MAFGIDGGIVVTFLTGAFSVIMGAINFLFTWLARHMFLLISSAFLISWFLTFYCLRLVLKLIVWLYELPIKVENLTLSSIFNTIFELVSDNTTYPFASLAIKCFDVINISFLFTILETLILPSIVTYFMVKFVQKVALMIGKR